MSNFKSGSGNLDFGGDETDDTQTSETEESSEEQETEVDSDPGDDPTPSEVDKPLSDIQNSSSQSASSPDSEANGEPDAKINEYPYFVRRSNVGDERDTRLEIHVRDKVADQEATFRSEVADQLEASEISKTDAREFALLAAFQHPERVAELMREEGFGTLD